MRNKSKKTIKRREEDEKQGPETVHMCGLEGRRGGKKRGNKRIRVEKKERGENDQKEEEMKINRGTRGEERRRGDG